MEELEPDRFHWIFVLQAFLFCTHYAMAQCRFGCRNLDQTNKKNDRRQLEKIMEEPERRRSKWISVLQAFVALACYALEQCRFGYHTPDERSQYFQRPSGALLGQVVLQRRFPHIGDMGLSTLAYHTRLAMACDGPALAFLFRLAARCKRYRLCDLLHSQQAFAPRSRSHGAGLAFQRQIDD